MCVKIKNHEVHMKLCPADPVMEKFRSFSKAGALSPVKFLAGKVSSKGYKNPCILLSSKVPSY